MLDADADAVLALRAAAPRRPLPHRRPRSARRKIALGHHADDFIETLLLNLFFAGALKAMPARARVRRRRGTSSIRPLVYVAEDEARAYTARARAADHRLLLPGLRRPRPAAAARQEAARIDLEREHPGVKQLDAQGARQRPAAPPPRSPVQPTGRAARPRRGRGGPRPKSWRLTPIAGEPFLQRVTSARVRVEDATVGEIGPRLLVLLGVARGDTAADAAAIAAKITALRAFEDDAGKMNLAVADVQGSDAGRRRSSRCSATAAADAGRRDIDAAPPGDGQRALRGGGRRGQLGRRAASRPASSAPPHGRSSSSTTARSRC